MKNLFVVLFSIIMLTNVLAQKDTVDVAPGVGTLNDAIDAAVAQGEAIASNTVFRLARTLDYQGVTYGANYPLSGSIQNSGYSLEIIAAKGDGPRPVLLPNVATGGEAARAFYPKGDLTIKGLYVTNRDNTGGMTSSRIVRCKSDGIKVIVDDCFLENDTQCAFRFDAENISLFMTNSIVANIGHPSSPDNGRVIDDRGNPVDSIVIKNCTFYNVTSRVLREAGGLNNYIEFDQNTFQNCGFRGVTLGETVKSKITNNTFIDCGYLGNNKNEEKIYLVSLDTLGKDVTATQECEISNNNIYLTPAIASAFPGDSIEPVEAFNALAASFAIGTTNEALTFTAGAGSPIPFLKYYTDPTNTPDFERPEAPSITVPYAYDFAYSTSAVSYSGSTSGKPLGDLNWFDMVTGISQVKAHNLIAVSCSPNPMVNNATVSFTLNSKSTVELNVVSLSGAIVKTVYSGPLSAGYNQVELSSTDLKSGVYFLRLANGTSINVEKFIVK